MATWVVGPDPGDDFATISDAVQDAGTLDGDVIEVKAGTYNESVPDGGRDDLTIRAHSSVPAGERPILDGQDAFDRAIKFRAGWTIEGLEIQNYDTDASSTTAALEGDAPNGSRATLRNLLVHDVGRAVQQIIGDGGGRALVDQLIVRDAAGLGINVGQQTDVVRTLVVRPGSYHGINIGSDCKALFCTVVDVKATGGGGDHAGIRAADDAGTHVHNCLVTALAGDEGENGIELGSLTKHGFNYVFGGFTKTAIGDGAADLAVANERAKTATGDAPGFVDPATDNYRLKRTSPLVGLGRSIPEHPADLDGTTRGEAATTNKALRLDGVNEYGEIDGIADQLVGTDYTLACWLQTTASAAGRVLLGINTAAGDNVLLWGIDSASMRVAVALAAWQGGTFALDDGYWHHLAITVDVGTRECNGFVDGQGVFALTLDASMPAVQASDTVSLGMEYDGGSPSDHLDADLTDMTAWITVLDASEIAEIYGDGAPGDVTSHSASDRLVAWYQLGDSDTNPTIRDTANIAGDGTLANTEAGDFVASDLLGAVEIGAYEATDDDTPPIVASARWETPSRLRITFSEAMIDNASLSDATNYVITPFDGDGDNATVTGVTPEPGGAPTFVDLATSGAVAHKRYLVTVG